jgi:histidinol-phosphatase
MRDFARELAKRAGAIALEGFGGAAKRRKADGTWVTEADEAAEREVRALIAERFPHHNVHGEEEGVARADGGPPDDAAPTWVVDPIDGTSNYVAGIPIWGTLVALTVDGRSVAAAINAPALGELYDAADGLGARFNGEPARVDPVDRLEDAMVIYGSDTAFTEPEFEGLHAELVRRASRVRGFGDFWGHMLVARGAAHVMIEPHHGLSVWDVAALEPIVREAGGRLTTLEGDPWSPNQPLLTTCDSLHEAVIELAKGTAPRNRPA